MEALNQLKDRILNKNKSGSETGLTNLLDMVREFSCLSDIIGRDYDVLDPKGKLLYTLRQKPMKIKVLNTLLKEFVTLKKLDNEKEAQKWGSKKGNMRKSRKR